MGKLLSKSPSSNNVFALENFKVVKDNHISKMIDRSITQVTAEDFGNATKVGSNAFYECSSLTTVTFPTDSQLTLIEGNAFRNCTSLTGIVIPSGITEIGGSAFYGCSSLTQIDIPDTTTTIGQQAFRLCSSVRTLKIGSGVTSIAAQAFYQCSSLQSITIEATNPPTLGNTNAFQQTGSGPIYVPTESVSDYTSDTNWGTYASRIRPEIQREHPEFTWSGTTITGYNGSDTNVVIPEGCTAIADDVFNGSSEVSIQISSTVASIGDGNFYDCPNLTTITVLSTTPPSLPQETKEFIPRIFNKSDNLTAIYVPSSSVSAYQTAPTWSWMSSIIQAIPTT